ncbi:MAG: hypothetical protein WBD64_06085 [Candidatus Zixiibacteriota bacterium]
MKKVKCPYCGHEYEENVEQIYEEGQIPVIRRARATPPPRTGKKSVDLVCPNCRREFEFSW